MSAATKTKVKERYSDVLTRVNTLHLEVTKLSFMFIIIINLDSANQEFLDEIKSSSCFDLLSSREVQVILWFSLNNMYSRFHDSEKNMDQTYHAVQWLWWMSSILMLCPSTRMSVIDITVCPCLLFHSSTIPFIHPSIHLHIYSPLFSSCVQQCRWSLVSISPSKLLY